MREIVADLVAEQADLDGFLAGLEPREWLLPTPAVGWDVRDSVAHLAHSEEYALNSLTEAGSRLHEALAYPTPEGFTKAGVDRGREMVPAAVLAWWRDARTAAVGALEDLTGNERVPWFAGSMSARSFATARLMETWAHGLDVHAALGHIPTDTDRLRHVARLSVLALPYAFQFAGLSYPHPVRLELTGPSGDAWVFGDPDTDQVIRGQAGEWCRVAVQRRDASDTALVAGGDVAAEALRAARAYV